MAISCIKDKEQLSPFESNSFSTTHGLQINTMRESGFRNHSARRKKIGNNYKAGDDNSLCCVFCNEKHLSSRCRNVTDIAVPYNVT